MVFIFIHLVHPATVTCIECLHENMILISFSGLTLLLGTSSQAVLESHIGLVMKYSVRFSEEFFVP